MRILMFFSMVKPFRMA
uniref:Uncharacterized protein n=1 Tax=Arundo donax TaxID=35708 RepID=A0A0A9I0N6_ARUDO